MFKKEFKSIALALVLGVLMVLILGACSNINEDGISSNLPDVDLTQTTHLLFVQSEKLN